VKPHETFSKRTVLTLVAPGPNVPTAQMEVLGAQCRIPFTRRVNMLYQRLNLRARPSEPYPT